MIVSPLYSRKYYKKEGHFLRKLSTGDNYAIIISCQESHELQHIQNSANFTAVGFKYKMCGVL